MRILLGAVLALLVGIGGYVGYAAIRAVQPVSLPAPTGPSPVGRVITEWTDHARTDPLAPRSGTPRELSAWLWYPANPGLNSAPAPYTPGAWAGLHFDRAVAWTETGFDRVRVHAIADAPVAAGRFPVVVLEPGLGFAAPQYTTLAENLASNGYLVVGVTPTYSANLTVLHGTPVPATDAGNPAAANADNLHEGTAQAAGDKLVDVWADDARFAAARVRTEARFAGRIDATGTVYIGHSFGGAAALQACHRDSRCAGAADLDGTQYGDVVHSGLDKPLMIIGGQSSCVTGACRPGTPSDQADQNTATSLLKVSTGPVWRFRISGAEHFNFTDYGAYFLAAPAEFLVALGPIDGARGLDITDAYLRAFADHTTRGRQEPLLVGQPPYSEVTRSGRRRRASRAVRRR